MSSTHLSHSAYIPFGKYIGTPIYILIKQDPDYLLYLRKYFKSTFDECDNKILDKRKEEIDSYKEVGLEDMLFYSQTGFTP